MTLAEQLGWLVPEPGRRMRSALPLLAVVSWILSAACTDDSESRLASNAVRDSAGVEIVENAVPTWTKSERWTLTADPLLVIPGSSDENPDGLLDPTSIAVDRRGRILVADGNQVGWNAVLIFDSTGVLVNRVGREGQGPGEFGQLWWVAGYRGDSIAAYDMVDHEIAVFDPSGLFARTVRLPNLTVPPPEPGTFGFTPGIEEPYPDGHFLAYPFGTLDISDGPGPAWYRHLLLRLGPEGQSWDTLGAFEISQALWTGSNQETLWFAPSALRAVADDGFYFTRADAFEISRYDEAGDLVRVIRRSHEPRGVTPELRAVLREWYLGRVRSSPEVNDQVLERIRQRMERAHFAEVLPAISNVLVDAAGNLWVEEYRRVSPNEPFPPIGSSGWSVFDPDGVWLGEVDVPEDFILMEVTRRRVFGVVADEVDVKAIHVYGLVKPGA